MHSSIAPDAAVIGDVIAQRAFCTLAGAATANSTNMNLYDGATPLAAPRSDSAPWNFPPARNRPLRTFHGHRYRLGHDQRRLGGAFHHDRHDRAGCPDRAFPPTPGVAGDGITDVKA